MFALIFQSTPSVWRETEKQQQLVEISAISIHSLRVEGDEDKNGKGSQAFISIHSLRVEGDCQLIRWIRLMDLFQSTPSVWRETWLFVSGLRRVVEFQSTPSVWRETH